MEKHQKLHLRKFRTLLCLKYSRTLAEDKKVVYECEICNKKYTSENGMETHFLSHLREFNN